MPGTEPGASRKVVFLSGLSRSLAGSPSGAAAISGMGPAVVDTGVSGPVCCSVGAGAFPVCRTGDKPGGSSEIWSNNAEADTLEGGPDERTLAGGDGALMISTMSTGAFGGFGVSRSDNRKRIMMGRRIATIGVGRSVMACITYRWRAAFRRERTMPPSRTSKTAKPAESITFRVVSWIHIVSSSIPTTRSPRISR